MLKRTTILLMLLAFVMLTPLFLLNEINAPLSSVDTVTAQSPFLLVQYANGSVFNDVAWGDIQWGVVDKVGVNRTGLGTVGFEANYGCVLWYPPEFKKPLMFMAQRAMGKIGANWHEFYIQGLMSKTPFFREYADRMLLGWSGVIAYNSLDFPVDIAVEMPFTGDRFNYKTNITTPVALSDVGIEYHLFVNPDYVDNAIKHVRTVRFYFVNDTTKDYEITGQNLDVTYTIPEMAQSVGLVTGNGYEINQFDFSDIFSIATSKWIRIEPATLPSGVDTYVLKIGCTFGPLGAGETLEIDPSTVGESTATVCVGGPPQRSMFYAQGLTWVSYCNGTDIVYRTSLDGVTFASETVLIAGTTSMLDFALWLEENENRLSYVRFTGGALHYRRGIVNTDGTLTWDSAEHEALADGATTSWTYPQITEDNDGYPWIGYDYKNTTDNEHRAFMVKSSLNNGTWSTESGFPLSLNDTVRNAMCVSIPVRISSGDIVAIFTDNDGYPKARFWNGTDFEAETIASSAVLGDQMSAVADGNNIHVAHWFTAGERNIYHSVWNHTTRAFETAGLIYDGSGTDEPDCSPQLSMDTATSTLYCFWQSVPTKNHTYYATYDGSTWSSETDWIDDTTDGYLDEEKIDCFYKDYGGKIGVLFQRKLESPFEVRFAYLVVGTSDSSDVGTSSDEWAIGLTSQRPTFYAHSRDWVFYSDDTNLVYQTSADGSSWSAVSTIRASSKGNHFDIYFDGTYVHYTWAWGTTRYRRGTPNATGGITWCDNEQTVNSAVTNITYVIPSLACDSSGYPYIGYRQANATDSVKYPYVTRSSLNNGTWSTTSGYPLQLNDTSSWWSTHCHVSVTPMTSEKMHILYANRTFIYDRVYDSSMGVETVTDITDWRGVADRSLVANNDDIHLVFVTDSSSNITHMKREYEVGWGSETTVQASTNAYVGATLTLDSSQQELYCFWGGSPTPNHIYYKKYDLTGGTWDASPTEWTHEIDMQFYDGSVYDEYRIASSYEDYNNNVTVVWMANATSPYHIKHYSLATISNTAPSNEGITISNMDDTNYLFSMNRNYTFVALYNDTDGPTTLDHVMVGFTDGTNWINATFDVQSDTWTLLSGSTVAELTTGSCTNTTSGNQLTATFYIVVWWNISDASNVELYQFCNDTDGASDPWEEKQSNYFNIETDLTISGFACDDDRGDKSQTITFTGTVYYEGTTTYPPDASFTAVHIYDSSNNDEGNDATIVNGAFSVAFTAPASVGTDTYNAYIDMAHGSYTDAEDANTDTFITDNFVVSDKGRTDDRTNTDEHEQHWVTLRSEYDNSALTSGSVTFNGSLGASWISGNSRWEYNVTKASVQSMALYVASINWDTYGVTSLTSQTSNTTSIIWDNLLVTFTVNTTDPPKTDAVLFTVILTREYDSTNVTSFSFNISRNATAFNNPHTTKTFTDTNSTEVIYVYDFTAVTDNTYDITSFTDPSDLIVTWARDYPTIGNFDATSRIYGNAYGYLHVVIVDQDNNITAGTITFENCSLQISGQIIFLWDNSTGVFSIYQDAKGYATLDVSACLQTTLNITAYRLSWCVKFGNGYPEAYKGAIATNTHVYDNTTLSASGSQSNYFYYDVEDIGHGGFIWTPTPPVEQPENVTWGERPYVQPWSPYAPPTGPPLQLGLWGLIAIVGGVMVLGLVSQYATKSTRRTTKKRTRQKRASPRDYEKRTKRKR